MDDIFEFMHSAYRLASTQVKAIAYDLITEITKRKQEIIKSDDKNKEELLTRLTSINDKIIELTDSLEEQLQELDQIKLEEIKPSVRQQEVKIEEKTTNKEEKKEEEKETSPIMVENPIIEKPQKEEIVPRKVAEKKAETKPVIPSITPSEITKEKIETKEAETTKEQPQQEEIKPSIPPVGEKTQPDIKEEIKEQAPVEETPRIEEKKQSPVEEEEPSSKEPEELPRKKFKKTTKNLSKAIMVRPNQLENLRKSHSYQEQKLARLGIFKEALNEVEKPHLKKVGPRQLPDEVERQIEDLTVKANIYYNEGETDKAQELYDKIKELNQMYQ